MEDYKSSPFLKTVDSWSNYLFFTESTQTRASPTTEAVIFWTLVPLGSLLALVNPHFLPFFLLF